MWITRLQLSNIKSYGENSAPIYFSEGVNLIQGHNGAGKSTILESIGLALFDSDSSYNSQQFVREGAKAGTIVLGFISAVDEREYEVIRGVGRSKFAIFDPEAQRNICTGKADTFEFIHQHLRLEQGVDLGNLFEDAVGVPQGTMTAIFLENATVRKRKFNKLLEVDTYEQAWEKLRDTGRYIADLMESNSREIAHLEGQLEDLPTVEAEIEKLNEQIAGSQAQLEESEAAHVTLEQQVSALDAAKQALDVLDQQLNAAQGDIRLAENDRDSAAQAVQESEAAQAVVAETRAAHGAYQAADAALADLESERQARDELQKSQHEASTQLQLNAQQRDGLVADLEEISAAEAELEQLAPIVARQQQLESELDAAKQAADELGRLAGQRDRHGAALADLNARFEQIADALHELHLAVPAAEDVARDGDLDAAALDAWDTVSKLENAVQYLVQTRDDLTTEQSTADELVAQIEKRNGLQVQADQLDAARAAARNAVSDARADVGRLAGELERLDEYEALMTDDDAICPVCRRPMDEHSRGQTASHYAEERERIQAARDEADQTLTVQQGEVESLDGEYHTLRQQIDALPGGASLGSVQQRIDDLAQALAEGQGAVLSQTSAARQALIQFEQHLVALDAQIRDLQTASQQVDDLTQALAELDDPQRRYDRAETAASRREAVEADLDKVQGSVEQLQASLADLDEQLSAFADLEDRLAAARADRQQHADAHNRYLAKYETAAQLETRQHDLAALEDRLIARRAAFDQLQAERDEAAAGYDADQHQQVQLDLRQVENTITRITTELGGYKCNLQREQARFEVLQQAQGALDAQQQRQASLQKRLEAFEFVRAGIRQAGPLVTSQIVRMIAVQANRIFGDILGDSSLLLEWSEDYAISVISGTEARDFKLLSGGEQMAAALAIRLALLTYLGGIEFAFFDEPTTNLDDTRREQLAERLAAIESLRQLFIISHDDTFEQESYHVIQVSKENGLSQVEML
jgi:exonuclease SbcC